MIKSQKLILSALGLITLMFAGVKSANAAQLQGLNVQLSDSRPGVSTTHTFTFTHSSNAVIEEFRFQYCTSPSDTCNTPLNLNVAPVTKGLAGSFAGITPGEWSVTDDGVRVIRLHHVGGGDSIPANTVISIPLSTIGNSDIDGSSDCEADGELSSDTCYVRVYSCTDATDCPGTAVDSGIVSYTVVAGVTVSARLDPIFRFVVESVPANSVHNEITTSVASTYNTLPFSNLTAGQPKYAAHALRITTNADSGYTVTMRLSSQMTGVYAANNIDAFPGSWGAPRLWTEPTGTTPNIDTAWIGANTTDTDITGWTAGSSPQQKFGPVSTSANATVMQGSEPEDGSNPVYVTYGIEVNVFQPGDTYEGTLIYSALPTY